MLSKSRTRLYARGRADIILQAPPDPVGLTGRISRVRGVAVSSPDVDPPDPGDGSIRPSGPAYLRYEDVQTGTMTLQQVLNAASNTKPATQMVKLTFPPGEWTFSDFTLNGLYGMRIPSNVSIYGSGMSRTTGTRFRMLPNTSSKAGSIPAQGSGQTNEFYLCALTNAASFTPLSGIELKNFALIGTNQGHLYNGIRFQNTTNLTLENFYHEGFAGNAASPPAETFGINFYLGSGSIIRGCIVDGRRPFSGDLTSYGASPLGYNNHNTCRIYDSTFQDCRYGMPTIWQGQNLRTYNVKSLRNRTGFNHERATNVIHENMRIEPASGMPHHITFMNDQSSGTLTLVNPSWTPSSAGSGKLVLYVGERGASSPNLQNASDVKVVTTAGAPWPTSQLLYAT